MPASAPATTPPPCIKVGYRLQVAGCRLLTVAVGGRRTCFCLEATQTNKNMAREKERENGRKGREKERFVSCMGWRPSWGFGIV